MSEIAAHRGISAHRIQAMVLRYWYLLMSSWPRLLELIYWPALQIITWGFLQNYISQNDNFFVGNAFPTCGINFTAQEIMGQSEANVK